jgi:hypothetical protein
VDGVDDLGVVDTTQVGGCDPEVRMPELPLDDHQRDPLARHLGGMSMAELMRREPAPDSGRPRKAEPPARAHGLPQLLGNGGLMDDDRLWNTDLR